jgi:hypothetical protein
MTAMAIERRTKRHTKCCMVLENLRTMPTATKYCIEPLSTTYADSDAMSVDSFPKFNAAKASSARDQSPA